MKAIVATAVLIGGNADRAAAQARMDSATIRQMAESVEIIRDRWGVPHIYGPTDASVVFGAAWAQAEDNWWQLQDNLIRSIGRGAEVHGEAAFMDDYLVHALEIPTLSIREYESATPPMRAMYDAYAAGLNFWMDEHPESRSDVLPQVEPWHTLAMIRFKYHHNEYLGYAGLQGGDTERLLSSASASGDEADPATPAPAGDRMSLSISSLAFQRAESPNGERALGSNQVSLSGRHTADGGAMLLINPHVSFFGLSQYWEVHLSSGEGLDFSGQGRFGFMLPYMGHSNFMGWGYTDNYSDIGDLWFEQFDDPDRPLAYRYGDGWRDATQWTVPIGVRHADGRIESRNARFVKTDHGPIVGLRADASGTMRPLAARVAKLNEGGWFAQWRAQMAAESLDDWMTAAGQLSVAYQNTMYADRDGNILYLYNAAVPRRDPSLDWLTPMDGSDPAAEWDGYHALDELPQFLNPSSGWLQNTNSAPLMATDGITRTRTDYPSYMVGQEQHNARAVSATRNMRALAARGSITMDDFQSAVLDTRLSAADRLIPELQAEAERLRRDADNRMASLAAPVDALIEWDREASTSSTATTLFVRWAGEVQAASNGASSSESRHVDALGRAVASLTEQWGDWRKPWGEVNRIQRPDASGNAPFDDALPSVAVPGGPGWLGSFFTFHTQTAPGGQIGYGVHGNSFVKAILFGPTIEARSILTFGASADPASPHYFDQAELYGQKEFKPAWFSRDEVIRNAERRYRPGG